MGYQPLAQEFALSTSTSTSTGRPESETTHTSSNQDSLLRRNNTGPKENTPSTQDGEPGSVSQAPRRRFLPQPVETSSRSSGTTQPSSSLVNELQPSKTSGSLPGNEMQADSSQPRRRILPQPIETTTMSRPGPSRPQQQQSQPQKHNPPSTIPSPRRFKPALIETEYRSVKGENSKDSLPGVGSSREFSMESSPGLSARLLSPRRNTSPHLDESNFSYVSLLRRQETRRHSFRVPSLPRISSVSSEAEEDPEDTSALLLPSSPGTKQEQNYNGDLSEYLLSVAARTAQRELKDQALAAFPNEQVYEPVDHFAIDKEEGDLEDQSSMYPQPHELKSRRQSSADLSWELDYMRQHKEEAEQRLRAMVTSNTRKQAPRDQAPPSKPLGPSPPMLGADIVLPLSSSPDGTLCENSNPDNGAQSGDNPCFGCKSLWCAESGGDGGKGAGLWMGTCHKTEGPRQEPHFLTGIMTPMIQDSKPGSRNNTWLTLTPHLNPTPAIKGSPSPQDGVGLGLGLGLDLSRVTSDEFNDGFVTQIYNYVSLGYPCVARYYDYELSRISRIAVEDLRQDDLHTDAKGYVVASDDQAVPCMRWKALRLYIREWARQQPTMAEDETGLEAWGMPERRGSWAI
ncbi:hypothetical protein N7478_012088 [Penicillium angulare]|uniref:uncharacterized protein n=1 Tax=Penicillium angulare TaxID=116970 RepID=UPI0025402082|nr:uncharacterized protein N7478_012088 [Penicillium angulare]KAJ5260483.1 hypothetical protein N7478_012088 [Penicillium angulare]